MNIVVVPAFLSRPHEPAQLARCVAAVLSDRSVDRVVVVDDASPVPLPPLRGRVEVLRQLQNGGPAAARNRGVASALALGAAKVLFTDVDCVPEAGWARALGDALASGPHVAVGGVTRALGRTLLDRYHDFAGSLNGRWILPERRVLLYATSCNMGVRAEALSEVRFDERFPSAAGEDFDLSHRLRRLGTIGLVPGAVVRHDFGYESTRAGLPSFLGMFQRYGEADPLLWEKHPELCDAASEACAAADLLAAVPPTDPAAYRRASSSRMRPQRYRPAMVVLRILARRSFKRGQAHPRAWRATPDASAASAPRPAAGA